ncbi:hypothetical protein [Clostridium lacusfryxellense]|uniref:hypothetical protein n=1 Tax=Clostridium lacusfryxellense TaxID=205328 RepID=UPI001C0E4136|nr:hypothetical protein [Clostridium lacusfryxellense]MBU3113775.1 hypothetical protein [Clostridium lacusfryxellense]
MTKIQVKEGDEHMALLNLKKYHMLALFIINRLFFMYCNIELFVTYNTFKLGKE